MISKNELLDNFDEFDEILLSRKLDIFHEVVTPKLKEIGLNNWNGKYFWYSDFNDVGIKHVLEYRVTKGFADFFRFGNCFQFVPTHNTKKLKNHRTAKSTHIQYAFHTKGFKDYDRKLSSSNVDAINTMNERVFLESIKQFMNNNISFIKDWFEHNQTIEENIKSLKNQINNPDNTSPMTISPEFVLSFLYKQQNEDTQSKEWLERYLRDREYLSTELIQDLYKKLN